MKDDVLREAARALREEADASTDGREETRARVMQSLAAMRARRHRMIRVLVPLAAVFVGSVAWASATHRMPEAWYKVTAGLGLGAAEAPAEPPAELPAPPVVPTSLRSADEPSVEPAIVPVQPSAPPAEAPVPRAPAAQASLPQAPPPSMERIAARPIVAAPAAEPAPAQREAASPAPAAAAPAIEPAAEPPAKAEPDPDALYRAAHQAHFVAHDASAALAGWNAYLAAAPRGRFALEAHYNRALCLVRLGRTDEARRALEPFATGAAGGYRQAEARTLLDAMSGAGK
jgi:hypothetical protein